VNKKRHKSDEHTGYIERFFSGRGVKVVGVVLLKRWFREKK
jgi:hypothetical protein